jgi:hypothetical protein
VKNRQNVMANGTDGTFSRKPVYALCDYQEKKRKKKE